MARALYRTLARAAAAAAAVAAVAASACDNRPNIDPGRAAAVFTAVDVATLPGLSGLAVDHNGALWTVAERGARAYRVLLDDALRPSLETFVIQGLPPDTDVEGLAILGVDRFALGTEGHEDGVATVLLAERRGAALVVTRTIALPEAQVGIKLVKNHGAEGLCGAGETILAGIEDVGETGGRRWAPIVRIEGGAIVRTHRLWLTTRTGKISGLDCVLAPDGGVTAWAVERHFEETHLLRFTLPPPGAGADELTPTVLLDLGPILNGRLNLEGIARLPDGRTVTVVDNQWKRITGPSQLLVFRPGVIP
ncbi:MAG TPA: esterase-like activity of phytase family protein [Kofleriaceae bacterium]|nr:esterase-like activity of phytase family protein [Kofleriaceae bacterium]